MASAFRGVDSTQILRKSTESVDATGSKGHGKGRHLKKVLKRRPSGLLS